MDKIDLEFVSKKTLANDTIEFLFKRPSNLEFIAGQHGVLTLKKDLVKSDERGNSRVLSFTTTSDNDFIGFATRMTGSGFKETLNTLNPGDKVEYEGPYGNLTLHKNSKKDAIFIIGGIGITPVISMIKDATNNNLEHKITLFFSNKSLENAPYQDDFIELEQKNKNFTFIQVLSHGSGSAKNFESGRMSKEIFEKYIKNKDNAIYYLSGPSPMVKAMREMLVNNLEIDEDTIKTEEFSGY
ncbi:FAD-dependent oxidoreductase [Candidatus Gracilibacteria bacterium]|nr:FAD-dependent oxidoreductase [Candidatus Gracilibacteria bacterium]